MNKNVFIKMFLNKCKYYINDIFFDPQPNLSDSQDPQKHDP